MATQSAVVSFNFVAQSVRIVMRDDEPWFVAVDVCAALTLANPSQALSKLDDDECQVVDFSTLHNVEGVVNQQLNPGQKINIINESGLYSLILTSRKPEAKKFKKWVTAEVLPAIRKTGRYVAPQAAPAPVYDEALERMSGGDLNNLTRLVWLCTHSFRFKNAFVYAIWAALRAVTGTPAPQRFAVQQIPVLAAEIRRIYQITSVLADRIAEAERTAARRIFRHGENAEKVLAEIERELAQAHSEDQHQINGFLSRWGETEIAHFVERRPSCGALYPESQEPLALR